MVVLVPKQLRMTGVTGNVPYYGGRLSPAQAYAASHPPRAAPPPPPPAPRPPPAPADPRERLERLERLLESDVITQEEYRALRERLDV
jgi:hypothetical protein